MAEYEYDFFISYAGPDGAIAESVRHSLEGRAKCFLDSRGLRAGAVFGKELLAAQSNSRGTVVIVSENTSGADYQQAEIVRAFKLRKDTQDKGAERYHIVPIRVVQQRHTPDLPFGLDIFTPLDLHPGNNDDLQHIAAELFALLPEVLTPNRKANAFILACDLNGFSMLPRKHQVKAYSLLGDSIRAALRKQDNLSIASDPQGKVIWSPGGDGGTLTLTEVDAEDTLHLAERIAAELDLRNRQHGTSFSIAMTLHHGTVEIGLDLNGVPNVWGEPINDANHMLAVCPTDQILASDFFCKLLPSRGDDADFADRHFGPPRKRALKHGHLLLMRMASIHPAGESFDRYSRASGSEESGQSDDPVDILDFEAPRTEMISRYEELLREAQDKDARSGVWTLLLARRLKDLGALPDADFHKIIRSVSSAGQRDRKTNPHHQLFSQFSDDALRTVMEKGKFLLLKAGSKLCSEGDDAEAMFVVAQGTINVKVDGKTVAKRRPGDLIGEMALIEPVTCRLRTEGLLRTAALEVVEESTVFSIRYEVFEEASKQSDAVQKALQRLYQRRQKESFLKRLSCFDELSTKLQPAEMDDLVNWGRLMGLAASARRPIEGTQGALVICGMGAVRLTTADSHHGVELKASEQGGARQVLGTDYVLEAVAASECFVVWNDDWRQWLALIERYGLGSALSEAAPPLDPPRKDRSAGDVRPLAE